MRKKRLISLLLSLIMVFSVIAAVPNLISAGTIMPFAVFLEDESRLVFVYNDSSIKDRYPKEHTFNIPLVINSYDDIPWYSIRKSVKKVEFSTTFADYRPTTTAYWFYNFNNLEEIAGIENLNTSEVTDMQFMFALNTSGDLQNSGKPELDLSTFNTSKVTDMSYMFSRCNYSTKIDVSSFDTSKVTDMTEMFAYCQRLPSLDLSGFTTTNVRNMKCMFGGCYSLTELDLSSFDTSKVYDMSAMFSSTTNLEKLNISSFDTSNVNDMSNMFEYTYGLKGIIDLSNFKTIALRNTREMFYGSYCKAIDISSFATPNVTDMTDMFSYAKNLTDIYIGDGWTTQRVSNSTYMFRNCVNLTQHGKYSFDGELITAAFARTDASNRGYMTYLKDEAYGVYNPDTNELTLSYGKYNKCRDYYYPISEDGVTAHSKLGWYPNIASITSVKIEPSFASYKPTNTDYWFAQMENLSSVSGLEYINMDNVTSSKYMFTQCIKLTELDLSSWNTSNLTDTKGMFLYDGVLNRIIVGNGWDVSKVTSSADMFGNCSKLKGGNGTSLDASKIDSEYARIDKNGQPGYLTGKMTVSFAGGSDTTGTAPATVTDFSGSTFTLPANTFTKSGYTFAGWSDGTQTYAAGAAYTIGSSDVVLTAAWNKVPTPTPDPDPTAPVTPKPTTPVTPNPTAPVTPNPTSTPTKTPSVTNPTTTPNPTKTSELSVGDFVGRCYSVALGREADEGGFNYWVSSLNDGQACGAQVGYGFLFSDEYMNKNTSNEQYVNDLYAMYFGREADEGGFNYWVEQLNNNIASREDVMAGFANSNEFFNLCEKYGVVCGTYLVGVPSNMQGGINCFVARLYKVCLNRLPDMVGQSGWVLKLQSGEATGSSVAYGFVFSAEFIGKEPSNTDFVNYMYAAFFGREADEVGLSYWVDMLNNGTAVYEDVFAGFTGSPEFANLCASYGINA